MNVVLALILNTSITTHSPVHDLVYYQQKSISFKDITELTRTCIVAQYGIYVRGEIAYQIISCSSDTIFKTGWQLGEYNRPKL